MTNKEYLDSFEQKLIQELLKLCTAYKMLDSTLLATDDIDEYWNNIAPEYIADAIKEINDYPTVSVAWAAYIGMATARGWDEDWKRSATTPYTSLYGKQGFDDMDEHIMYDILGMVPDSKETSDIEEMIRRCAQLTVNFIRHEQIEPQSPTAFYVFTRAAKSMFRLGAAIELKHLGYKFELANMPTC